jgi:hypothetical protein
VGGGSWEGLSLDPERFDLIPDDQYLSHLRHLLGVDWLVLAIVLDLLIEIDSGGHVRIEYLSAHRLGLYFVADLKHLDVLLHT